MDSLMALTLAMKRLMISMGVPRERLIRDYSKDYAQQYGWLSGFSRRENTSLFPSGKGFSSDKFTDVEDFDHRLAWKMIRDQTELGTSKRASSPFTAIVEHVFGKQTNILYLLLREILL